VKQKTRGYIVIGIDNTGLGGAFLLQDKTLWLGNRVTMFSTRNAARNAIQRTKTLEKNNNYNWPWLHRAYVQRVVAE